MQVNSFSQKGPPRGHQPKPVVCPEVKVVENQLLAQLDSCRICFEEIADPVFTSCCGTEFCEDCLKSVKTAHGNDAKCPNCRAENLAWHRIRFMQALLSTAKVKCEGCKEVFNRAETDNHMKQCGKVQLSCPNHVKGCSWYGDREALSSHIEDSCEFSEHGAALQALKFANEDKDRAKKLAKVKAKICARGKDYGKHLMTDQSAYPLRWLYEEVKKQKLALLRYEAKELAELAVSIQMQFYAKKPASSLAEIYKQPQAKASSSTAVVLVKTSATSSCSSSSSFFGVRSTDTKTSKNDKAPATSPAAVDHNEVDKVVEHEPEQHDTGDAPTCSSISSSPMELQQQGISALFGTPNLFAPSVTELEQHIAKILLKKVREHAKFHAFTNVGSGAVLHPWEIAHWVPRFLHEATALLFPTEKVQMYTGKSDKEFYTTLYLTSLESWILDKHPPVFPVKRISFEEDGGFFNIDPTYHNVLEAEKRYKEHQALLKEAMLRFCRRAFTKELAHVRGITPVPKLRFDDRTDNLSITGPDLDARTTLIRLGHADSTQKLGKMLESATPTFQDAVAQYVFCLSSRAVFLPNVDIRDSIAASSSASASASFSRTNNLSI
ncbi:unnamed protein product [Amoebophrya sp. A120]|nr:unnamed protein product [Amoebophrya sp. A120]|eukprot:GSA120T00008120001.1